MVRNYLEVDDRYFYIANETQEDIEKIILENENFIDVIEEQYEEEFGDEFEHEPDNIFHLQDDGTFEI